MTIGYRAMTFSYLISFSPLQCHFQPFRCFFGYEEKKVSTEIFLFLVKMRDQSSSYNQQLSKYDILRFGTISSFFGPKNGTSTELQTHFFGNKKNRNEGFVFPKFGEKIPQVHLIIIRE